MYLYNTSFHISSSIEAEFLDWLRRIYIPLCIEHGFENPLLTRVLTSIHPNCSAFAFQVMSNDIKLIEEWEMGHRKQLMKTMFKLWGENCMIFSTNMEIMEL